MRNIVGVSVACGILCFLCGCVLVPIALVGGGIVGGIAISEDTVQTEFDRSYDQVWNASLEVMEEAGKIETKDKEAGRIQGHVPKSNVRVTVDQLTETTVRIQVKSRKIIGVVPDIKTSHKIAYRIGKALEKVPGPEASKAEE